MFSSYKFSNGKKSVVISSTQEKQVEIKALVKALHLKIVAGYVGNEDESFVLKKEQAEDDNREKKIQELKHRIKKISKNDKSKALNLKNRILQKEKIIKLIGGEVKNLTARKNKVIKLYDEENEIELKKKKLACQFSQSELVEESSNNEEIKKLFLKEDKASDEFLELEDKKIKELYFKNQQAFLQKIYIAEEKSQLEKKITDLKVIIGQEKVVGEIKGRLIAIIFSSDNNNYYKVIEQLQHLMEDLNVTKSIDQHALKSMDVVKLAKQLFTQKTLLEEYKAYLLENKENKKEPAQVKMSPAYQRTKLIIEANTLRAKLNRKVVNKVRQKYTEKIQQFTRIGSDLKPNVNDVSLAHITAATQYCIATLEQVNPSVQKVLQKKCIDAGWSLDKQKGLVYKDEGSVILLMSDIHDLSCDAYIEVGNSQLSKEPKVNFENFQMVLAKPSALASRKRILSAFDQNIEISRQKLVPYKKLSSFWLFCLDKVLVAVKPEVIGLMQLKTSLCRSSGNSKL